MALNATGPISIGGTTVGESINLELNLAADTESSIGETSFRTLANVPTGTISLDDFHGKSNVIVIPPITTDTNQYILYSSNVPGYIAGQAKVEISINSGVYLYSSNTANPALTFFGFTTGDVITVKNSGYIIGCGGDGGGITYISPALRFTTYPATVGGTAISTTCDVVLQNNGYIAGGGGGGALNNSGGSASGAGGGGAGGGKGGSSVSGTPYNQTLQPGGAGGAPGQPGGDGQRAGFGTPGGAALYCGGGGGGRILPGVGGAGGEPYYPTSNDNGKGGGAGGGGGSSTNIPPGGGYTFMNVGGAGGSAGAPGADGAFYFPSGGFGVTGGGGGGGWGASGGASIYYGVGTVYGAAGGKAVRLNGYTATITGSGYVYGAVS